MPVDRSNEAARKHEGFSANPWCLWVSDIPYMKREYVDDSDEGEYRHGNALFDSCKCSRKGSAVSARWPHHPKHGSAWRAWPLSTLYLANFRG